jgi:hypothetical protein
MGTVTALAECLAGERADAPPASSLPAVLARNLLFFSVVLFHGFRRLLPPY